MTVAELIEKLKEIPQGMDVCIYDWDCGMVDINSVSIENHDLDCKEIAVINY